MRDYAPELPSYNRKQPLQWCELVEQTESQLAGEPNSAQPSESAIRQVLAATEGLDNEALESARYYSIGLIACNIARKLQHDEDRKRVIQEVSNSLLNAWRSGSYDSKGLMLSDLEIGVMDMAQKGPFLQLAQTAVNELPATTKLLANSLHAVAMRRMWRLQHGKSISGYEVGEQDYWIKSIATGKEAATNVGQEAISGAAAVIIRSLVKIEATDSNRGAGAKQPNLAIVDIIDAKAFQQLSLHKLASQIASLRQDELFYHISEYIGLDEKGAPIFLKAHVLNEEDLEPPSIPNDPEGSIVLHTKRLRCPALNVPGFIPLVVDIMQAGIMNAQERTANKPPDLKT